MHRACTFLPVQLGKRGCLEICLPIGGDLEEREIWILEVQQLLLRSSMNSISMRVG